MGRYTDTQLASWQKVKKNLGKMHYDVLSIIQVRGGASSQEIADCLHRPLHSISGRLRELQDQGKICDSGKRYLNQKSGHTQIVWVAVRGSEAQAQPLMLRNASPTSMT